MDILKDKCRVHPLTKQMPRIKRKLSKVFKKKLRRMLPLTWDQK